MSKFTPARGVPSPDKHALKSTPVTYKLNPGGRPKKTAEEKVKGVTIYFTPDELALLESIAHDDGMTVQTFVKALVRRRIRGAKNTRE